MLGKKTITDELLPIFWRFGLWHIVLLCNLLFLFRKKESVIMIVYLPVFTNTFTILVGSGWSDYRYGWSIFLATPFILLLSMAACKMPKKNIGEGIVLFQKMGGTFQGNSL